MIILENATKSFSTPHGRKYILNEVTSLIPSGVNVGILGRNGAGKSTLLRMLGGIDFPDSGKIHSDKTFSWPMGLSGGFQGSMTGRQNVKFVCRIYGRGEEEINEAIKYVLEFSELGEYFDMPIKTYSSGMRSRLGFGLSLAFDFDYYLIDEVLSVGDIHFREKAQKVLKEKIFGRNILLVSHIMPTLRDMCDVGIVLNEGNMEYYNTIHDAIIRYNDINQ